MSGADKIISPSCADCQEIWEPQPAGILRALPSSPLPPCAFMPELGASLFPLRLLNQDARGFTRNIVNILKLFSLITRNIACLLQWFFLF